jgi:hypothetical protein
MGTLLREKLEAKLDIRKQGIQMEKMLSQQDFLPGLIHKLNNHLAPVIGYGQLLLPKTIDPEAKQYLEKMIDSVANPHMEKPFDLNELKETIIKILKKDPS